jgi:hypothetical protein
MLLISSFESEIFIQRNSKMKIILGEVYNNNI